MDLWEYIFHVACVLPVLLVKSCELNETELLLKSKLSKDEYIKHMEMAMDKMRSLLKQKELRFLELESNYTHLEASLLNKDQARKIEILKRDNNLLKEKLVAVGELNRTIEELNSTVVEKTNIIETLKKENILLKAKQVAVGELNKTIVALNSTVIEKAAVIETLNKENARCLISEKENKVAVGKLNKTIDELNSTVIEKSNIIETLKKDNILLKEKQIAVGKLNKTIDDLNSTVIEQAVVIETLNKENARCLISENENKDFIRQLNKTIAELNSKIIEKELTLTCKECTKLVRKMHKGRISKETLVEVLKDHCPRNLSEAGCVNLSFDENIINQFLQKQRPRRICLSLNLC